jgi:hypothetical protein
VLLDLHNQPVPVSRDLHGIIDLGKSPRGELNIYDGAHDLYNAALAPF